MTSFSNSPHYYLIRLLFNELNSKGKTQESPLVEYFSEKEYNSASNKKDKRKRQDEKEDERNET